MKMDSSEEKKLMRLKVILDKLMLDRETSLLIRANEFYEFTQRDLQLRQSFPTSTEFSRFLRKMHHQGILKQFIPNYEVDTSNNFKYQWYFHREINKLPLKGVNVKIISSSLLYNKYDLKIESTAGIKLRSNQEKLILEQLMRCNYLTIKYDYPIEKNGEKRFTDFLITNNLTQKTYYWEHFGMTHSDPYLNKMVDKIEWYKNNGFKIISDGGNLIYTIYKNDNSLQKDIEKYTSIISK